MEIKIFIKDYMDLVNDPVVKAELTELTEQFNTSEKTKLNSSGELLRQYIAKARKIVKPCIRNRAAYEEIVWRHNLAINSLPRPQEGI